MELKSLGIKMSLAVSQTVQYPAEESEHIEMILDGGVHGQAAENVDYYRISDV